MAGASDRRRVERYEERISSDERPTPAGAEHEQRTVHGGGVEQREEAIRAADHERRERFTRDVEAEQRLTLTKVSQAIWWIVGAIEVLLGLRFLLKLLAANPNSPFAQLVYDFSALFLWPFFGLFPVPAAGGMQLEPSTLIAMLVYALIAWGVVRAIWLLFDRTPTRSVATYDRERT